MQRSSPRARAGFSRFAASLPPSARAGADDRVQFVDEQDDVAGVDHFFDERFEAFFEFAAELRAGDERAHVERDDAAVLEAFGHVALEDAQRESFDDRRFADAWLADEHRVVFRAPREHLNHAADFLVAADHRIELALAGTLDQVDAVLFEGLKFALGRLVGHALRAPHRLHAPSILFFVDRVELQHVLRLRLRAGEREQQVLGRNEVVLHAVGFGLRGIEHFRKLIADARR